MYSHYLSPLSLARTLEWPRNLIQQPLHLIAHGLHPPHNVANVEALQQSVCHSSVTLEVFLERISGAIRALPMSLSVSVLPWKHLLLTPLRARYRYLSFETWCGFLGRSRETDERVLVGLNLSLGDCVLGCSWAMAQSFRRDISGFYHRRAMELILLIDTRVEFRH